MSYEHLTKHLRDAAVLDDVGGMLHWDASTYLPENAHPAREEQLALLSRLSHHMLSDPRLLEWVEDAKTEALDAEQAANLALIERRICEKQAVPAALAEALVRSSAQCERQWRAAKANNDYASVIPVFEELLARTREHAQVLGERFNCTPYDALLQLHDMDTNTQKVNGFFADIEQHVRMCLGKLQERNLLPPECFHMPVDKQQTLAHSTMQALGFDFTQGRLDTSLHPFCGGAQGDIRLTSTYDAHDMTKAYYAVLHETGHALYEAGLPERWRYQPLGLARSYSVHESQSLYVEMQLGYSRAFSYWLATQLGVDGEAMYHHRTHVEPGFIRIYADELTYPLHVTLRTKLEQQLLDASLRVQDLPEAWNMQMQSLLGITPPDDARGCLQDIHWYSGSFGYFPTYTLGAMIAAQLAATVKVQVPEAKPQCQLGNFEPHITWLRQNIHQYGSKYSCDELLMKATGKPLSTQDYFTHLHHRYCEVHVF